MGSMSIELVLDLNCNFMFNYGINEVKK